MTHLSSRECTARLRLSLAAVMCAAAITACGSAAAAAPILTLAHARAAAENYGRVDSQASARCSRSLNDTVETGDLAAIDDANDFNPAICAVRGAPAAPSPQAAPPTIPDDQLVVPRTTAYPAYFMQYANADLGHGGGTHAYIWVLGSPSSGAAWRAKAQVEQSAGPLLAFRRDAHGYAPAPLPASASGYRLTPEATCDTVARYYTALYNGAASPPAVNDPSDIAKTATNYRDRDALLAAHPGFAGSRTWTCARADIAEPTRGGDALVVFTLRGTYSFTPPTDVQFSLTDTYADGKQVTLVPPGLYTHVASTELFILAALVPPRRSQAAPELIGSYAGIVHSAATPA